jgi:hypothetical protein
LWKPEFLKVADYIRNRIDRLPKGYVFTYQDFINEVNKKEAVIKSLNRMVSSGKIAKLAKGKYYKQELSPFGELPPDQYEVVKDLLEQEGRIIGYITGLGVYNRLGLTTQVSNIIEVGRRQPKPSIQRGRYKIKFILQKNTITKDNIPQLQVLDAIKFIRKIPDENINESCLKLKDILKSRGQKSQSALMKLVLKYPPSTRALLGAMLEDLGVASDPLQKTLNPITNYNYGISKASLMSKKNWNIT